MMEPDRKEKFTKHFKTGFSPQDDMDILEEEKLLIELINTPKRIIFRSNHASNILPLSGTLPRDKKKLIKQIDLAMEDEIIISSLKKNSYSKIDLLKPLPSIIDFKVPIGSCFPLW